jgi:hypothetical protein
MTSDNLLTGLVGGFMGGLLGLLGGVILAIEQRLRWRRENKAATTLVSGEVTFNLVYLERTKTGALDAPALVSMGVWESERVRVASFLSINDLQTVSAAYVRVGAFVSLYQQTRQADPEGFHTYVTGPVGRKDIDTAMADLVEAEHTLRKRTGQSVPNTPDEHGWLGLGPSGRIMLDG